MDVFSKEQLVFLKTVYKFCKLQHHYSETHEEFINEVVDEAFEDKTYRLALYQKFHTKEQIIYILRYICAKIWFKINYYN